MHSLTHRGDIRKQVKASFVVLKRTRVVGGKEHPRLRSILLRFITECYGVFASVKVKQLSYLD
jgi:hypothetical protein